MRVVHAPFMESRNRICRVNADTHPVTFFMINGDEQALQLECVSIWCPSAPAPHARVFMLAPECGGGVPEVEWFGHEESGVDHLIGTCVVEKGVLGEATFNQWHVCIDD